MPHRSHRIVYYCFALLAVGLVIPVRLLLTPLVGPGYSPFMLFPVAIVLAVLIGGVGPGILATLASAVLGTTVLTQEDGIFGLGSVIAAGRLGLFLLQGAGIVLIARLLDRARARADAAAREAARHRETVEQARRYLESVRQVVNYAIFTLDGAGVATSWNEGVRHVLGFEQAEWVGQPLARIFPPEEATAAAEELERARRHGCSDNDRWQVRKDGTRFYANGITTGLRDPDGNTWGFIKIMRDRTALKRAEDAQHEHAERLSMIMESVSDIFFALDRNWRLTYCNRQCARLAPDGRELVGQSLWEVFPKLAGTEYERQYRRALETGQPVHFEAPGLYSGLWLEVHVYPSADGLAVIAADQTERRQAEAARTQLMQMLVTAQEEERLRISRELHDQMGQHVAALGLQLKTLEQASGRGGAMVTETRHLRDLIHRMGGDVHRIGLKLRPTALDDLGLAAGLANHVDDWSRETGIAADFDGSGLGSDRLPFHLETAVYRTVQEALTNVVKHAQARHVSVIIARIGEDQLSVIVEDDGKGFDAEAALQARPGGRMGLLGMRERINMAGGTLRIESGPGRGTTVYARVPLPARAGGK